MKSINNFVSGAGVIAAVEAIELGNSIPAFRQKQFIDVLMRRPERTSDATLR